jgi:hypothetical protein
MCQTLVQVWELNGKRFHLSSSADNLLGTDGLMMGPQGVAELGEHRGQGKGGDGGEHRSFLTFIFK